MKKQRGHYIIQILATKEAVKNFSKTVVKESMTVAHRGQVTGVSFVDKGKLHFTPLVGVSQ